MKRVIAGLALLLLSPSAAVAANCSGNPFTLTNGTTADATQVMANFNNLLTCANNNLAHNASNSDITSLSGLTTPLSVAQGGTGAASLTSSAILVGAGTSPISPSTILTAAVTSPQLTVSQANSGGETSARVTNSATAANTQARFDLVTGTANAFGSFIQTDGATPNLNISIGAADSGGIFIDSSSAAASALALKSGTGGITLNSNGGNFSVTPGAGTMTLGSTPFPLTSLTNSLTGDVALNNSANYFDGPTVAQGTSGTWFVSGTVTLNDSSASGTFQVKLWDGTTVIASAESSLGGLTSGIEAISVSGVITSPAGNLRISVRESNHTTGVIAFNATGNSKDSTITAIRIQ